MRAIVTVGEYETHKTFRDPHVFEREIRWLETVPWACAELLSIDSETLTLTTKTYRTALELPDWRPLDGLAYLLRSLGQSMIHHRDVHVKNIICVDGEPRLLDWETATIHDGLSYDLHGPVDVPVPVIHGGFLPQWWGSKEPYSIKSQWGVDVPEWAL